MMHAVRNIRLCTKDCLCLYVCPTGATDTETGQIDAEKCISGCRVCVDACPSHAISLIPEVYPAQQEKTEEIMAALRVITKAKIKQEQIANEIAKTTDDPILKQLARAIALSSRIMAEDLMREAGYMLPQSQNTKELLQELLDSPQPEGFPTKTVENLIKFLNKNNIMEDEIMNENKTYENLMEAFAGESQANRKYLAYAKKAEKDGNVNAAKLFKAAAEAETIHALRHFETAGKVATTAENLQDAVEGETHEYKEMYPDFLTVAQEEGNKAAILTFTYAKKAEEVHARLYKEALENLDQKEEISYYLCPVCGNIEKTVPDKCSICGVPGDKFIKY